MYSFNFKQQFVPVSTFQSLLIWNYLGETELLWFQCCLCKHPLHWNKHYLRQWFVLLRPKTAMLILLFYLLGTSLWWNLFPPPFKALWWGMGKDESKFSAGIKAEIALESPYWSEVGVRQTTASPKLLSRIPVHPLVFQNTLLNHLSKIYTAKYLGEEKC